MKEPAAPHELARRRLQAAKLRATAARVAVWERLSAASGPLSHVELAEQLERDVVDKSTVFRVLQDFVDAGLARRLDVGDHVWRYELLGESPTKSKGGEHAHPHLLCVECGSVTCLDEQEVKLRLRASVGAVDEILLKGRCAPCRDGSS